ncbi:MAG: phosphatase PAP2 family protein, partial [Ferruginibacter sp.]
KIYRDTANDFFDQFIPFLRISAIWLPLYFFMVLFFIINFPKKAFAWLAIGGFAVTATDIVSSRFFKPLIGRLRPCNDPSMAADIHLLASYCGQNGSFTSSHAANHFALATFFFITLHGVWGKWCYLFFAWAFLICYSQVYVGVHYPFDVAGGALLGVFAGGVAGNFFNKRAGKPARY